MKKTHPVLLLIIVLLCAVSSAHAVTTTTKRRIDLDECLRLIIAGEPINNRLVTTAVISQAIRSLQRASLREDSQLVLVDSVVEGELTFGGIEDTPIKELPPDLRHWYEKEESADISFLEKNGVVPTVKIIPIRISMRNTTLKDKVFVRNVIFQAPVDIDHSVFKEETYFDRVTFHGADNQWSANFVGSAFQDTASFIRSNFQGRATFAFATFQKGVSFYSSKFPQGANFAYGTYHGPVSFLEVSIYDINFDKYPVTSLDFDFSPHIDFDGATFDDVVNFNQAIIQGKVTFYSTVFRENAYFIDLNKGPTTSQPIECVLEFSGIKFLGRLYFINAKVNRLSFFSISDEDKSVVNNDRQSKPSREPISPTSFEKPAIFAGLQCDKADFTEAEFHDYVDFSRARFSRYINFNRTVFAGGSNFDRTEFPISQSSATSSNSQSEAGLTFDDVRFEKATNLEWKQLKDRVNTQDPETWARLIDTFKLSGNLEGQNEAMYERKVDERESLALFPRYANLLEQWYWGYGVRPLWLLAWMLVVYVLFTIIYFTQTKPLSKGQEKFRGALRRLKFAFSFGLRTSWTINFGYRNARTPLFKTLTVIQSIGFKIMLVCLLKTVSNTSPLLNDLMSRLIHV